jgi:DNA/RNA-binding domain of Phe-tRNA-synthetase-like protein
MNVTIVDHPLLDAVLFVTVFPKPLGELETTPRIRAGLEKDGPTRTQSNDQIRKQVRDLLRQGGYKPTGRGKPSSEYLLGVAAEGALPSINLAVDACNLMSLDSGLPISVVDLDRAREPLSIRIAAQGTSYVFNASGQTIDLGGLLCLFDADGPCANAVKDAQRTKTHPGTLRTLTVIWNPRQLHGDWIALVYRRLLEEAGARTEDVG